MIAVRVLGLLLLVVESAVAATTVADGEFPEAAWSTTEVLVAGGATHAEARVPSGGNPGAFRSITIVAQPTTPDEPGSNATLAHAFDAPPIDPVALGGIAAIDFSFDVRMLTTGGMQFGLLVFQDGVAYAPFRNPIDADPEQARAPLWTSAGRACLTAEQLYRFPNGAEHPDFSAPASPITFGFHTTGLFSGPGITNTVTGGIDDFAVTVHAESKGCSTRSIAIELTDGDHVWEADPLIPYAITVTNGGAETVSGLVVTQKMPARTTFVADASTGGWACTSTEEGGVCTFALPDIPAGGEQGLAFGARVQEGTDPRWTVYAVASTNPTDDECSDGLSLGCGDSCTTLGAGCDDCPAACNGVPVHAGCEGCDDCAVTCGGATVPPDTVYRCCFLTLLLRLDLICQEPAAAPAVAHATAGSEALPTYSGAVLYRARDEVFGATPGGRRATELYYRHAADIIRAGVTDPAFNHAYRAFTAWYPHLAALVGPGVEPETVTDEQLTLLTRFLDALHAVASPALRAAIDRGRTRLQIASWAGLTSTEALARLDDLVCPLARTYPSVACRIDDAIALLEEAGAGGPFADKLAARLARARADATGAGASLDAGDVRAARRLGGRAARGLRKVVKRLAARRARRDLPATTIAALHALADAAAVDLRALRKRRPAPAP